MKHSTAPPRSVNKNGMTLALSLPLSALIVICAAIGLVYPEIYSTATPNWMAQTVGQDAIDLFLVAPLLLVSGLYTYKGNRLALIVWGGTLSYLVYTFLIYCFCVNFNPLFGLYCGILGLSLFSFISFLQTADRQRIHIAGGPFIRVAGWYFIVVAISFYMLWMMEVIPASIAGSTPPSVAAAGLPTNPVHVIDLSMFLPAIFLLGVMLLRKRRLALYLTPVALIFFVLMDVTIVTLTAIMMETGNQSDAVVLVVMSAMTLFSFGMLIWFLRATAEDLSHSAIASKS
jgi:hypothetical protein